IIAVNVLFIGLSNIFGVQILNSGNREKDFLRAALIGMLISLLLNFLLIPRLGYVGASISSVTAELVVLLFLIKFSLKIIRFAPKWRLFFSALLCSLPFIPVYILLHKICVDSLLILICGIIFSTVSYFVLQYYVFRNALLADILKKISEKIRFE